jgi:signal transduction histidine kinase
VMIVASARENALPSGTERRLAVFTALIAAAIASAEARAELAACRARTVATADETRRRIERDLHDGAQQRLVALALQLRVAQQTVPPELSRLQAELGRVAAGLIGTLEELREYARGIHPAILAVGGLAPALKTLARRSPLPVTLDVRLPARLPERVEVTAYYVVSEALANVAKHAGASAVHVDAGAAGDVIRVAVRDDGGGGADPARGVIPRTIASRSSAHVTRSRSPPKVARLQSYPVEIPASSRWRRRYLKPSRAVIRLGGISTFRSSPALPPC